MQVHFKKHPPPPNSQHRKALNFLFLCAKENVKEVVKTFEKVVSFFELSF